MNFSRIRIAVVRYKFFGVVSAISGVWEYMR